LPGVIRTRVGYAGGTLLNPTYHNLGDHTETVQIDFDPQVISYARLLEMFWQSHNPGRQAWSRQYKAAVFYHDDGQKRLALASREQAAARLKGNIYTEILPATAFYLAEGYHQKYYLQQAPELWGEYVALYPALGDLVNSTAAARVNGYLAGHGTPEGFQRDLPGLGLSPAGRNKLIKIASSWLRLKASREKGQEDGGACALPPKP
jgi:methionine-S-sulfoxide reductase